MKPILKIFHIFNFIIKFLFGNSLNEKKMLKNILKGNDLVFFDVGSNLGENIKFIKKTFGNNVEIHAFEPSKESYNTLKQRFPKINLNNTAISNYIGNSTFYERNISSQSSLNERINHPLDGVKNKYTVEVSTLDEYVEDKGIKKIDLLKIDTEGNDYKVLDGAQKLLSKIDVKLIKIECLFDLVNSEDESEFKKIFDILSNFDFKIYSVPNLKHINNRIYLMDLYFINNKLLRT